MGVVPEAELQRSFDRAFAVHTSNFPVSAYDLKTAYDGILADERAAEQKKREELRQKLKALETDSKYQICDYCFNGGFRPVSHPKYPGERFVVKCSFCNYWFNRRVDG